MEEITLSMLAPPLHTYRTCGGAAQGWSSWARNPCPLGQIGGQMPAQHQSVASVVRCNATWAPRQRRQQASQPPTHLHAALLVVQVAGVAIVVHLAHVLGRP